MSFQAALVGVFLTTDVTQELGLVGVGLHVVAERGLKGVGLVTDGTDVWFLS